MQLLAAVLRSNCKRLSDHLVVVLDAAEPEMWEAIRAAHGKSVAASLAAIEAGLTDVGLWEPGAQADDVRERFDALVHDKVGDKAAEGSMADRIFHKFDSHYNRGRSRVWRMLWDDPIKEFEAARAKALHLLSMCRHRPRPPHPRRGSRAPPCGRGDGGEAGSRLRSCTRRASGPRGAGRPSSSTRSGRARSPRPFLTRPARSSAGPRFAPRLRDPPPPPPSPR